MEKHKKPRGLWSSIIYMKCPRCREGNLFEKPTFAYSEPTKMPESCEVCGQNFMPEPGFWFGAMFISYIWTAWFCLFFVGGGIMFLGMSVNAAFGLLILMCAIFFFWIFRISRSIWIHIYVKYDPEKRRTLR